MLDGIFCQSVMWRLKNENLKQLVRVLLDLFVKLWFLRVIADKGGVYMRKLAPARVSYWDDFLISHRVYIMTGSFHISLFKGTFHVDKIHLWFKIANITHALPVPLYRQTDFTPKRVVVSRLHDTVARFRTGVKFSPRCENRGGLTPNRWDLKCLIKLYA